MRPNGSPISRRERTTETVKMAMISRAKRSFCMRVLAGTKGIAVQENCSIKQR